MTGRPLGRVLTVALLACLAVRPAAAAVDRAIDTYSFARPAEARVTDLALELRADFAAKTLAGTATLTVAAARGARDIVLDTKGLVIERVSDETDAPLPHALGELDAIRGQPLRITLPASGRRITVQYRTTPASAALQWLAPEQTAGKQQPYLFSQGQAILTRTWIPTQDSPGIRQTYRARIVVPPGFRAVMSAEHLTPDGVPVRGGVAFEFALNKPVPPYLIALAVGDIAFRPLGPAGSANGRTGVFAEPSVLDRAAYEFADLERMLEAAEALYGPYRWGRYDILVMPPSFPFGGMENPRLTFVSPTVLAGDRSLTSIAAHELAHSWSGNLVTNATWRDFWLNEGFTTYFENRIMEQLYGSARARMLQVIDRQELKEDLYRFAAAPRQTVLYQDPDGRNPDESLSSVPYGKGAAFLRMLEAHFGRERFDRWLRSYFDRHAFQSITTPQFLDDLRATLLDHDERLERELRIREWLFEPGLPANDTPPTSDALEAAAAEARRFAGGTSAASLHTSGWVTQQWQRFLAELPDRLSGPQMADLDRTFQLSGTRNAEVLFLWLRVAVRNQYAPAYAALEQFLTSQGRRKFVEPLYTDLMKTPPGRAHAARIYAAARPLYHSTTRQAVAALIGA